MTLGEMYLELEMRDDGGGETYAGGMTERDIEEIKAASAELRAMREKAKAKANDDQATQG